VLCSKSKSNLAGQYFVVGSGPHSIPVLVRCQEIYEQNFGGASARRITSLHIPIGEGSAALVIVLDLIERNAILPLPFNNLDISGVYCGK
jgi:hypothetical protein